MGDGDAGGRLLGAVADGIARPAGVIVKGRNEARHALVEIARDRLMRLGDAVGRIVGARAERGERAPRAVLESRRQLVEPAVEIARNRFVRAGHAGGGRIGARAKRFDDALAAALQGLEQGGDAVVEGVGRALVGGGDLRRSLKGAGVDRIHHALDAVLQRERQRLDACPKAPRGLALRLGEADGRRRRALAGRTDRLGLFAKRRAQPGDEVGVAGLEGTADAFMRLGHFGRIALALRSQRLHRDRRRRGEPIGDVRAEGLLVALPSGAGLVEPAGGVGGGFVEGLNEVALAALKLARDLLVGGRDARGGKLGVGLQRHGSRGGRLGEARHQRV